MNLVRDVKGNKGFYFYRCIRSKRKTRKNMSLLLIGQETWGQRTWKNPRYSILALPQSFPKRNHGKKKKAFFNVRVIEHLNRLLRTLVKSQNLTGDNPEQSALVNSISSLL